MEGDRSASDGSRAQGRCGGEEIRRGFCSRELGSGMSSDKRKFEQRALPILREVEKAEESGYGFAVNLRYRPQMSDGIYQRLLDSGLVRRARRNRGSRLVLKQNTTYDK